MNTYTFKTILFLCLTLPMVSLPTYGNDGICSKAIADFVLKDGVDGVAAATSKYKKISFAKLLASHRFQEAIWDYGKTAKGLELKNNLLSELEKGSIASKTALSSGVSVSFLVKIDTAQFGQITAIFKPDAASSFAKDPWSAMTKAFTNNFNLMTKPLKNRIDSDESLSLALQQSYKHELAAFHLHEYLGLNFVPLTVSREIDGMPGSLQFWVESAETAAMTEDKAGKLMLVDRTLLDGDESGFRNSLDFLLANIDRDENLENHKIIKDMNNKLVLFDHGMSFLSIKKQNLKTNNKYELSPESWNKLKELSDLAHLTLEFPMLTTSQIKLFHERILTLLKSHS